MALTNQPKVKDTITGTEVTDSINLRGHFSVSISGTFTGSVFLKRDVAGETGLVVEEYTEPFEDRGYEAMSGAEYYFEAGGITGNATVIIGDGGINP